MSIFAPHLRRICAAFIGGNLSNHLPRMVTIAIYGDRRAYAAWVKMMEIGPLTLVAKEVAMRAGGRQFNEAAWHRGMAQMAGTINWAREQDEKPGN